MTPEKFTEMLNDDDKKTDWEGDNTYQGLMIIAKYFDPAEKTILQAASHDQIWSVGVDEICEAGLTDEDAASLVKLNWMEEDGCLSCFV